ncbi:hypothetical protein LUZ63_012383 [Rhynchospora breviuscula]|uniref:Uncharacterized protein n=1 Tax=Rhynchospora breviuscula TaxID=2022672 RepID=A0A9Q0HRX6_9POAL|nr:hypothetical protein LUZ63_012383 [Rhynchospora breviuscula]
MAESLLTNVLGKLAAFAVEKAVKKFQSLYGIRREVEILSRELTYIQAFIKDADRKHIVEERQLQWVKDVIDIAYQIEDAVDIFLLECPEKLPGFMGRLQGLVKKATQLSFLYKFQEEIKKIQGRIREIKQFRETYEINTLGGDEIPQPHPSLLPIGDPEVVGFARDGANLVKYLLDDENTSLTVVSIVGPGGLGKTTLARKVCNSIEVIKTFGEPIWITVSQKYDLLDILTNIEKHLNVKSTDLDANKIAQLIWNALKERRYLIVLDDVWTEKLWAEIAKVLPNTENGSRVLITTRIANVAKGADTTYDPYELPALDDEQSLELFLQKAVPKKHQCPGDPTDDLKNLAIKFVAKCKGLPLALVVLGSLLSKTPYNFHAWNTLLQSMSWQDTGNECTEIIATSYDHLSFAKKLCFMYFAAYPEDFEIEAKPLLRMWVAEQLIPHEERRTLEETSECFLEDLVQRSMVQVSKKNPDGSIKYCRVHDVLRELAVKKAKEINFLMVCSKPNDWERCSKARRVAIHYSLDLNEPICNYANSYVRSLLFFGDSSKIDHSKYRVLRVLGNMRGELKLQNFKGSPHLRYLQLQTISIKDKEREFGEWIKKMKYLETLDLRKSLHSDLSEWIWQAETLKHVLLSFSLLLVPTQGPPSSVNLRNLQSLSDVRWSESWEASGLPNIPEVRELCIVVDRKAPKRDVASLLDGLKQVVNLTMRGDVIDLLITGIGRFPFYENLRTLVLDHNGDSDDTLVLCDGMLPPHLIELVLGNCEFELDPMPVLEKLVCLKFLWIRGTKSKDDSLRIECSAGGFKQLECLILEHLVIDQWEIEIGAMPMLKYLRVWACGSVAIPPEVMHLHSLQHLDWQTAVEMNYDVLSDILEQRPHLRQKFSYDLAI